MWKVLSQSIHMCNMKALSLLVRKSWPRLKFLFTHRTDADMDADTWAKLPGHSSWAVSLKKAASGFQTIREVQLGWACKRKKPTRLSSTACTCISLTYQWNKQSIFSKWIFDFEMSKCMHCSPKDKIYEPKIIVTFSKLWIINSNICIEIIPKLAPGFFLNFFLPIFSSHVGKKTKFYTNQKPTAHYKLRNQTK